MHTTLSRLATEYRRIPVATRDNAGALDNPTTATAELAFIVEDAEPEEADWVDAQWETSEPILIEERGWPQPVSTNYKVRLLIGPDGGHELDVGSFDIWARITDVPETIVRKVGRITITGEEGS